MKPALDALREREKNLRAAIESSAAGSEAQVVTRHEKAQKKLHDQQSDCAMSHAYYLPNRAPLPAPACPPFAPRPRPPPTPPSPPTPTHSPTVVCLPRLTPLFVSSYVLHPYFPIKRVLRALKGPGPLGPGPFTLGMDPRNSYQQMLGLSYDVFLISHVQNHLSICLPMAFAAPSASTPTLR